MAKAIGIDFGTTNSVAAVWEADKEKVIPNSEGSQNQCAAICKESLRPALVVR